MYRITLPLRNSYRRLLDLEMFRKQRAVFSADWDVETIAP